jgi:hypothetical protein
VGQLSACHRPSGHFYEIYDARTGVLDGGWQAGRHWDPKPDQIWSATAYLAMIPLALHGSAFRGHHVARSLPATLILRAGGRS